MRRALQGHFSIQENSHPQTNLGAAKVFGQHTDWGTMPLQEPV